MTSDIKETSEKSLFRRLCEKSLILSCLAIISSRLLSYLKGGIFSRILGGGKVSDDALRRSTVSRKINTLGKRYADSASGERPRGYGVQNLLFRPLKLFFASQLEKSRVANGYKALVRKMSYTAVKSYGAYLTVFGIYLLMVYYLKLYAFNVENPSPSTPLIGVAMMLISVPLLFSKQPLLLAVKNSALLGGIFEGASELKYDENEPTRFGGGTAIIFGSVCGVLSFFFGEVAVLKLLGTVLALLFILYSPEIGLFATAMVFPFSGEVLLLSIVWTTLLAFLIKVARGKRSMSFGAAEVFAAILGVGFFFSVLKGGGRNASVAFCMTSVYLLASNLLSTPALLRKCLAALSLGFGVVCVYYAGGLVSGVLDGGRLGEVALSNFSVFDSADGLSTFVMLVIPAVFYKLRTQSGISKLLCSLLAIAYILFATLNGHTVLAFLTAAALTVYFAVCEHRVLEPILMYLGVPVGVLYFTNTSISLFSTGFRDTFTAWVDAVSTAAQRPIFGFGMSEGSLSLAMHADSKSMYFQSLVQSGICGAALFTLAVFFAVQRIYSKMTHTAGEVEKLTAAVGAMSVMALLLAFANSIWTSTALCYMFWLSLGCASACFKIRVKDEGRMNYEEYR